MTPDLPGDPGLPPGVTDDMTEARSLTPRKGVECAECEGGGGWFVGLTWFVCPKCDGDGVEE